MHKSKQEGRAWKLWQACSVHIAMDLITIPTCDFKSLSPTQWEAVFNICPGLFQCSWFHLSQAHSVLSVSPYLWVSVHCAVSLQVWGTLLERAPGRSKSQEKSLVVGRRRESVRVIPGLSGAQPM